MYLSNICNYYIVLYLPIIYNYSLYLIYLFVICIILIMFIVLRVGMLGVVVGRVAGRTASGVQSVRSSANQVIKYFRKQFMTAGEDSCGRQEPAADETRGSMGLRFIFRWLWASLGILVTILTPRDVLPCHSDSPSPLASLLAVL